MLFFQKTKPSLNNNTNKILRNGYTSPTKKIHSNKISVPNRKYTSSSPNQNEHTQNIITTQKKNYSGSDRMTVGDQYHPMKTDNDSGLRHIYDQVHISSRLLSLFDTKTDRDTHQRHQWNGFTYTDTVQMSSRHWFMILPLLYAWLLVSDSDADEDPGESLLRALTNDNVEDLEKVLKYLFVDPQYDDFKKHLALIASSMGALECLKWIHLNKIASLKTLDDEGSNVMIYAAGSDNYQVVEWLISQGFSLEFKNLDNYSAVFMPAITGNIEMMRYLTEEKKCDIIGARNKVGASVLHVCTAYQHPECLEYLISKGADFNDYDNSECLSPIIVAAESPECLKILIDAGANVNHICSAGYNALMMAAVNNPKSVEILLEAGVNPNVLDNNGVNAAFYAIHGGSLSSLELLVDYGINLRQVDKDGKGLLVYACSSKTALEFLEKRGLDLKTTDRNGNSLLHVAAELDSPHIIRYLLANGLDVNVREDRGGTPLIHAVLTNSLNSTRYLLSNGADVNDEESGSGPLLVAAYHCYPEIAKLLLAAGADKELVDFDTKKNALELATDNGCQEVVDILNSQQRPVSRLRRFNNKN